MTTETNIFKALLATLAAAAVAVSLLLTIAQAGSAAPAIVEREATGEFPGDIQASVDAFRADLGGSNNGVGNTFPDGRREINWDGVPDSSSAPNNMPADLFRGRGAVFSTPGSGFQLSADSSNPTNTPLRFGNRNSFYSAAFRTFSPERLFTPLGSNVTEVKFFLPGTTTPATVDGFGAVFTDVDKGTSAKIEYLGTDGTVLFEQRVPAEPGVTGQSSTLSFTGAAFDTARVAGVRITGGSGPLDSPGTIFDDAVAMDDFIYGESQTRPAITPISPDPGSRIGDRTPTVKARITDAQTDLEKDDIKLFLDGKRRDAYDRDNDRLTSSQNRLDTGTHRVKIEARDGSGLVTTRSWTFKVQN